MSTETKRITPAEVVAAYARTGLKPRRGVYCRDGHACGLGVKIAADRGIEEAELVEGTLCRLKEASSLLDIPYHYVAGFLKGFDDDSSERFHTPDFALGVADGRAAAAAVFGGAS